MDALSCNNLPLGVAVQVKLAPTPPSSMPLGVIGGDPSMGLPPGMEQLMSRLTEELGPGGC